LGFSSQLWLDTEDHLVTEQTTASATTSTPGQGTASDAPIALVSFNRWLLRALPGQQLQYHRGHLIWDRSPASALAEGERRALARAADAALQAADDGLVHLVQRRNGELDFSYLAIKAARPPSRRNAASHPYPSCARAAPE
jgi:hypothetical protein